MALSKKEYELALSAEKGYPVSLSDEDHKQLTSAPIEDLGGDDRPTNEATKKADAAKWNSTQVEDLGGDDRPTNAATKQADAMRWGQNQMIQKQIGAQSAPWAFQQQATPPWALQMAQQQQMKAMNARSPAAPLPMPAAAPVYSNPWEAAQAGQAKRMGEASELERLYQIAFGGDYGKY